MGRDEYQPWDPMVLVCDATNIWLRWSPRGSGSSANRVAALLPVENDGRLLLPLLEKPWPVVLEELVQLEGRAPEPVAVPVER